MSRHRLVLVSLTGLLGLSALVALALALVGPGRGDPQASPSSPYTGSTPPDGITLPSFALRDERGALVSSQSVQGKVVLLTFLSAPCREACPLLGEITARALDELAPAERRRVTALGLSVNPRADTPAARRAFLARHRAEGRLRYLSGTSDELFPLWRELGVLAVAASGDADVHSAPLRLYGAGGTWVATLNPGVDLTVDNLVHDLRVALAAG